jgi:hypothetical protein
MCASCVISAERLWEWKRLKTLQRHEKLEALKQKKAAEALKDGSAPASPPDAQAPTTPPVDEAPPSDSQSSNDIMYPPSSLLPPDYSPASDAAYNYDSGYQYGYGYGYDASDNGAWSAESPAAAPALVDSSNYYYNDGSNYTDYGGTGNVWEQWSGSAYDTAATATEGYQSASAFYQDATAPANGGGYYDNSYGYTAGDNNSYWPGEGAGGETSDAGGYATSPVDYTTPVDYTMGSYASPAYYEQAPSTDDYSIDVDASGYAGGNYGGQQELTPFGASEANWTSPWEEVFDPQTGQTYYSNRETGETAWERPEA